MDKRGKRKLKITRMNEKTDKFERCGLAKKKWNMRDVREARVTGNMKKTTRVQSRITPTHPPLIFRVNVRWVTYI